MTAKEFLKNLKNAAVSCKIEEHENELFGVVIVFRNTFDANTYYFKALRNGWDASCFGKELKVYFE